MKRILVMYSSQTGQMDAILQSLCSGIAKDAQIDFHKIELENPYPFPWKNYHTFFDAMPESVMGVPQAIVPLEIDTTINYDLVILGYQPWFLSPSIPMNSFLKSDAAKILANKPVVTVIGCRNMWLRAQEKVKELLIALQAKLVGNIVLDDKHSNWASTMSIVRWMIHGQKEASEKYPEAGVSQKDIDSVQQFGPMLLQHLQERQLDHLQASFLAHGAIPLRPNLIVMENNGAKQFPKWAAKALAFGKSGNAERDKHLKKFKNTLFVAVFLLSPISGLLVKIKLMLKRKQTDADLQYFKNVHYLPGKI